MKEDFTLIKYKYENGVYDIFYLLNLVQIENLTEEEFFQITRHHFKYYEKINEELISFI